MEKPTSIVSTKVQLAGRVYPIKVQKDELEELQRIAGEVNEKIRAFKESYPSKDIQDCLSMALLTYAVDNELSSDGREGEISDELDKAHALIDEMLSR
jgi:cell division protein ZapA